MPHISIVIPVFNEQESLRQLLERLAATMEAFGRPFEVIAVDDGSADGSLALLRELQGRYPWLRIIRFARNFGQNAAVFAGFAHVRGQQIVVLDADLQNPPEEIPKLVQKLEEGYEVVGGWRVQRRDSLFRILPSKVLNFLVCRITGVYWHDHGCALKAYQRHVVDQLCLLKHHSRYVPAEIAWMRVRVGEVQVGHSERAAGTSKYGFLSLVRITFDLLTNLTTTPIQMIGFLGWLFAGLGFLIAAGLVAQWMILGGHSSSGIVVALFLILSGVQMMATGYMCEYVSRIFIEVQNRPYYVIKEVFEQDGEDRITGQTG